LLRTSGCSLRFTESVDFSCLLRLRATFGAIYFILLVYSLCYMPTMASQTRLPFARWKDPKQDFGSIRVWYRGMDCRRTIIGYMGVESTAVPISRSGRFVHFDGHL